MPFFICPLRREGYAGNDRGLGRVLIAARSQEDFSPLILGPVTHDCLNIGFVFDENDRVGEKLCVEDVIGESAACLRRQIELEQCTDISPWNCARIETAFHFPKVVGGLESVAPAAGGIL